MNLIFINKLEHSSNSIKINESLKYILETLIIYFAMFSWVSFGSNNLDTQPFLFLVLILYFFIVNKINDIDIFYLWLSCISILIVIAFFNQYLLDLKLIFRAVVGYSTLFLTWIAALSIIRSRNVYFHIVLGSWIYFFGALLQYYTITIFDWMSANRTTLGRGVTSFAAEPTYLGIVFFFKSWVLYNLHKGKFNFIFYSTILANLLGILILAKSSMVLAYIFFVILFTFFLFSNFRTYIYTFLILLIF